MIRLICGMWSQRSIPTVMVHGRQNFFSHLLYGERINNQTRKCMFSTESEFRWTRDLKRKAFQLMAGDKRYDQLRPEEQRLVDLYQKTVLREVDGVILPNTRADLEQQAALKILKSKSANKG